MRIETLKDDYLDLTDLLEPKDWEADRATVVISPINEEITDALHAHQAKKPYHSHSRTNSSGRHLK